MCVLYSISEWFLLDKEYFFSSIIIIFLLSFTYITLTKMLSYISVYSDVDVDLFNNLHMAITKDDAVTTFKLVQKYSTMINIPHQVDGYSPFMRACLNGRTQLVRIMLNYGADISLRSAKGETPFYLAAFYYIKNPRVKDATCLHALYHAGSDVNVSNYKGYSPLQLAAMFGHTQLVIWLLNKGASSFAYPDPYLLARLQGHYETAMVIKRRRLPALEQLFENDDRPKQGDKRKIIL